MKYLIIIPARGGSKGIPNKNIVSLKNIPLIEHTIFPALSALKEINDSNLVISTDDKEIKRVSEKAGANVPFLRPDIIADDFSPSTDYVSHAIKYFEELNDSPENILILQPTSPLRTKQDILKSIVAFEANQCDSLISVYEEHYINNKVTYQLDNIYGIPNSDFHNSGSRRQDDKSMFVRNGAIYLLKAAFFKKNSQVVSDRPLLFTMDKSRSINIDT